MHIYSALGFVVLRFSYMPCLNMPNRWKAGRRLGISRRIDDGFSMTIQTKTKQTDNGRVSRTHSRPWANVLTGTCSNHTITQFPSVLRRAPRRHCQIPPSRVSTTP